MARLNAAFLVLVVVCALGVITSQHQARKFFIDLESEQAAAKKLAEEWTQLQLEQSTWAMHARIEKIASGYLRMRLPAAAQVRFVSPRSAAAASTRPGIRSKKRP